MIYFIYSWIYRSLETCIHGICPVDGTANKYCIHRIRCPNNIIYLFYSFLSMRRDWQ